MSQVSCISQPFNNYSYAGARKINRYDQSHNLSTLLSSYQYQSASDHPNPNILISIINSIVSSIPSSAQQVDNIRDTVTCHPTTVHSKNCSRRFHKDLKDRTCI